MTSSAAYEILGLTPKADKKAIKKRYRYLMHHVHPDSGAFKAASGKSYDYRYSAQEINAAYSFLYKMIILNYRKILKIQAQQNTLKKTQNIPITTVLMMQLLITHLILIIHLRIKPSGRLRQIQMPILSAIYTTIQKIVTAMCLVLLLSQLESIYGITTRIFRSF